MTTEPQRTTLHPHDTGIFSVQWNESDTLLVTCSGDQTARISCAATSTTIQTLRGHSGTVKSAAWDPNHPDLLSTAGRDGTVCLWDLRAGETRLHDEPSTLSPVMRIVKAHETATGKAQSRKAVVPKSVTGILYNKTTPHELISSGSSDG